MANEVKVRARVDDQVSGPLAKMRDKFDQLGKNKGAQAVLQGVGLSIGTSSWAMLSNAIGVATDYIGDSIGAASDLNETITKSQAIFGDSADEIEAWADTASTSFGQSKREALDAASGFAGLFKTVGIELDTATGYSQQLTELGADLASFFNTDVADALGALKSGLQGESEPLRRFNVFLSETAVAAKLAQMGIQKVGGQFTEAQKATARYALIMEQTVDAQGDFERTSDGLANTQRTLNAQMEDLSAAIGEELLPVMVELAGFARDTLVPALREAVDWFKKNSDEIIFYGKALVVAMRGGAGGVELLEERLGQLRREQEDLGWEGFRKVFEGMGVTAYEARRRVAGLGDAAGGSAGAMEDLKDETRGTAKAIERLDDSLSDLVDKFFDDAQGAEELRLKLRITRREGRDLQRQFDDLNNKPKTAKVRAQLDELRLAILENKREQGDLNARLTEANGITIGGLIGRLERLGVVIKGDTNKAWGLVNALAHLPNAAHIQGWGAGHSSKGGSAWGGYVPPGTISSVGEGGEETLTMFPGGGGYVTPHARETGTSTGGSPVVVQLNLDGAVVAKVVDRHLYYAKTRAPRPSFAT